MTPSNGFFSSFRTKRSVLFFVVFTILYFLWYGTIVGLNAGNYMFFTLLFALFFGSVTSRQFLYVFTPFVIYLICYDSLRILHDYNIFPVHNEGLYQLEVQLFGVEIDGVRKSLNEYFVLHQHKALDILSGIFYISWVPFPLCFTILLFFKKWRMLAFRYWFAFLITNLFGFLIYIGLPAAPPWYYLEYGAVVDFSTPGNPAGLMRFDQMFGISMYQNMYSQASNVFGALPSMHAAFPLLLSYYSLRYKNWILSSLFIISLLAIWFGAVYTTHHYVIDIISGIICGIFGIIITEYLLKPQNRPNWLDKHVQKLGVNGF